MREIKFRGKRLDNGEWVYGSFVQATEHTAIVIYETVVQEVITHEPRYFDVDPETIGQFTGIKDMDGKKIYEGDVVTIREHEKGTNFGGVVLYAYKPILIHRGCKRIEGAWVASRNGKHEGHHIGPWRYGTTVIGNIHDNGDLI